MRVYQHVIDTKAVKQTMQAIPDHWVIRDLSERDYGIDLMVEIFEEVGSDANGHTVFDATGHVCYLQIKGTNNALETNADNTISFSIKKKALLYVEKFATPFLLVRTCTLSGNHGIYYLWLQRYISEILDFTEPDWRENEQKTHTVHVPVSNQLPEKYAKIEHIASRIKYIEEHAEFFNRFSLMKAAFDGMINKTITEKNYKLLEKDLNRIKQLKTLLRTNNCQVNENSIETLIQFVKEVENGNKEPKNIDDFPTSIMYNLELLENDNFMRKEIEQLLAENDDETVY